MPINSEELMTAVEELCAQENLTVTVKESVKGACIAGICALTGGLLGGPPGLACGGILGSIIGAVQGQGKYKSVVDIIRHDMTPTQREKFIRSLELALSDVTIEDGVKLTLLILNEPSLKLLVIRQIGNFLKNEMGIQMLPL
ncbi:protein C19orf12 homolog [Agrilus planipennis]|uniref:Protein C19orf12 homolog n=1 Tax=Agrilus planipennis TaxID=224129 RepID=A0A1W4WHW0_AGRPL|nr:protein C19orf12 homolog [Agrilus planipennis]